MGITDVCRSGAARLFTFDGFKHPSHMAIGSGTAVFSGNQTALGKEIDRNSFTGSGDLSVLNKTTFITNWSSTDVTGASITELGVFNSGTGGGMFSRHTFDSFTKDTTVELEMEVTYEFF